MSASVTHIEIPREFPMRLGKSTFIYFVSQIGLSLAGFIATFVIARVLGADVLGTYSIAVAMIFWLNVPAMAISSAINKRISEGSRQGEYLSAGFVINGFLAVLISLTVVIFGQYVDEYVGAPVSELLAIIVLVNIMLYTVTGALDGQKKVASRGILQAGERVIRTGAQVGLIFLGWELTGLLIGHAGALAVAAVLGVLLFEVKPSLPSLDQFHKLVEYARYSWVGTLQTRALGWMDTIVLAFFVSSTFIGIYEVAWRLASMLALVGASVQQTLFPEFSDLESNEDTDRIHHLLNEGLIFTGIFCIPGLVGTAILGDRLLKIYRPEFAQGAGILIILVTARAVSAFGSQFLSAINAVDRPDIAFKINALFIITNTILNVSFVYLFGWYGAAIATTLSALVILSLGYYGLSHLIGSPNIPLKEILYQGVAASVMGTILLFSVGSVPRNNYLTIGLVFLGALIYTLVLLVISTRVRSKIVSLFLN